VAHALPPYRAAPGAARKHAAPAAKPVKPEEVIPL